MGFGRQFAKAGSTMSLPFIFLVTVLAGGCFSLPGDRKEAWTFQEFQSSCIDLGYYDAKSMELTVRFVNPKTQRFYRYSNVPSEIWGRLIALNETGGVGNYLNETVVGNPKKYPFEELTIRSFNKVPRKKKAGSSN
jgi:hypothetical protein